MIASGGLEFEELDVLYRKRCVSKQDRQLCKGVRGERTLPTGKVHGFKRYDKVQYLRKVCFVKARRTRGDFVLMDIDNSTIDFRDIGGRKEPPYKFLKRLNTRRYVLCTLQRVEREGYSSLQH